MARFIITEWEKLTEKQKEEIRDRAEIQPRLSQNSKIFCVLDSGKVSAFLNAALLEQPRAIALQGIVAENHASNLAFYRLFKRIQSEELIIRCLHWAMRKKATHITYSIPSDEGQKMLLRLEKKGFFDLPTHPKNFFGKIHYENIPHPLKPQITQRTAFLAKLFKKFRQTKKQRKFTK